MIKDQGLLRHEDIRKRIQVLPELEDLIPPLLADEFSQLETNILKEGCREALLIWEVDQSEGTIEKGQYILVDGHNRFRICTKHQLDFRIHLISFPRLTEVKDYMIDNQLGRRNLSPEQISYLRGKKYNAQKLSKGKYERSDHKGQNVPYEFEGTTAERLAEQFNVSQKTIKRDAEFAEGLDKLSSEKKKEVLSGKLKMRKSDIQALARGENLPTSKQISVKSTKDLIKGGANQKSALIQKINTLATRLDADAKGTQKICEQLIQAANELKSLN